MPDFPKGVTLSVAEIADSVWAHATRILTNLDDTRAAKVDNLDALLSTRLPTTDFDARLPDARATKIDNVDALISSRSSHVAADIWGVAARTITELKGIPRSDLLGEDLDFEAGAGARKAKIDNVLALADFNTRLSEARAANLDASIASRLASGDFDLRLPQTTVDIINSVPVVLADVEGTASFLTTDDYPKTVELVKHELGTFFFVEGIVDLSANVAGETVTVTEALSLVTPVDYKEYASESYTGTQTLPALYILTKSAKHGLRVQMTMETAPAADREYPYQFFAREIA